VLENQVAARPTQTQSRATTRKKHDRDRVHRVVLDGAVPAPEVRFDVAGIGNGRRKECL
jgi:hypothetical protein